MMYGKYVGHCIGSMTQEECLPPNSKASSGTDNSVRPWIPALARPTIKPIASTNATSYPVSDSKIKTNSS